MGARVLVVDDDPWILRMVTATLQKRDYVVDTAREGRQALQRVRAAVPDVIISDVMMPVMDGWTLVEQLRQDPNLATIPVIFLTALGKDEARAAQFGLEDRDFLAKPFRFADLERRVAAAVARAAPVPARAPEPDAPAPPTVAGPQPGPQPGPHGEYPGYGPMTAAASPPPAPEPPPRSNTVRGYAPAAGGGRGSLPAPPTTVEVQAATGHAGSARRTTALNGRLEQLQLSSLLVMMEMERKDGVLSLKSSTDGPVGRIFLRGGQVVCAKLGPADTGGKEAVYEMLRWKAGTFSFSAISVEMEDSIESSTTHLLMEGARRIDEDARDDGLF